MCPQDVNLNVIWKMTMFLVSIIIREDTDVEVLYGRIDGWRWWGVERETTLTSKCSEKSTLRFQEALFSKNFCSLLSYMGWEPNYKDNFNRWKSKMHFDNYIILVLYFVKSNCLAKLSFLSGLGRPCAESSPPPVFLRPASWECFLHF